MNVSSVIRTSKKKLSIKIQTFAAFVAIVVAVALPQLFHVVGVLSGLGNVPGEVFLPMHLPIIAAGLLAGPYVGSIAGFVAPVISFCLSGMPSAAMLPFMMIELCIYGLSAGILYNVKMPTIGKVVFAQFAGRVIKALAIVLAVYAFSYDGVNVATIWMSLSRGIAGLAIQWIILPLFVFRVENAKKYEQ